METEKYTYIGKIVKPHGINGDLKITFRHNLKDAQEIPGHFFIPSSTSSSSYLPHFVERLDLKNFPQGFLKFVDTNDRSVAETFKNKSIYIEQKEMDHYFLVHTETYFEWVGYHAEDQKMGDLGMINEIMKMPAHPLAVVDYKGAELLIPLVKEFILKIDKEKEKILFKIPDGLIEGEAK